MSDSTGTKAFFKRFRVTWPKCRPICKSTIYPYRHSIGSQVSRLGLWEFYQSLNIIREEGLTAIGYSEKHQIYHLLVRRSRSNFDFTARKLRAVYTVYRETDDKRILEIWHQLSVTFNAILPFLKPFFYSTEVKMVQEIVTTTLSHPTYTPAHVAAKLQLVNVFKPKNQAIIDHINDRVEPIGQTPLMIAIQTQNYLLIKAVIDIGASLLPVDFRADSILHYAALSNNFIFKYLLERVKTSHKIISMLKRRNGKGYLPLHWCCYSGHIENLIDLLKIPLPCSMLLLEPQSKTNETNDDQQPHKSCGESSGQKGSEGLTGPSMTIPTPNQPSTGGFDSSGSHGSGGSDGQSTSSTHDEMITFTSEMIADLDPHEMTLGGSPIHWAMTRRILERLLEKTNIPLDSYNFKHETPLHVMTRKRRLKCAVILLSRGVDVSARDRKGNTPLHRAVQKEDISMVQGLIAFDSDINGLNNRRQTPRHIAATKGSTLSSIIVNVLHRVGAKRCPPGRKKCTEDCAHNATGIGTPFPKWSNYENETPYEDFMSVRADELDPEKKILVNPARLLCLDGGGTRGLFSCCALLEIERRLKRPLRDYFEWFAGTSSGALIAALLALGTPLHQIRSIYYQFKDKIFQGPRPYNSELLEKVMKERMGPTTTMNDIKDAKRLLITAVSTHHNPAELWVFRNIPSTEEVLGLVDEPVTPPMVNQPSGSSKSLTTLNPTMATNYGDQLIWQACRASGAAPSYFSAFGPFIDGGLVSNNPTLDGMSEFFHYNRALAKKGRVTEIQQLSLVLSMGTGKPPTVAARLVDIGKIMAASIITLPEAIKAALSLQELAHMMISTTLQTDGHVNKRAQAWCTSLSIPFYRFTPPMSEELLLNETNDIEIVNGMWETKAYMYAMSPFLEQLAQTLELIERRKSN